MKQTNEVADTIKQTGEFIKTVDSHSTTSSYLAAVAAGFGIHVLF